MGRIHGRGFPAKPITVRPPNTPSQPFDWTVGPLSIKWDAHTLQLKWRGGPLK